MWPEGFISLKAAITDTTLSLNAFKKLLLTDVSIYEWGDHNCGCSYSPAPCWHCTDCPDCNCSRCDEFHLPDEECPALLNPMAYKH